MVCKHICTHIHICIRIHRYYNIRYHDSELITELEKRGLLTHFFKAIFFLSEDLIDYITSLTGDKVRYENYDFTCEKGYYEVVNYIKDMISGIALKKIIEYPTTEIIIDACDVSDYHAQKIVEMTIKITKKMSKKGKNHC